MTSIIPCLRYRKAPAAIEWLVRAFGFEKHLVVGGEDDQTIEHAQLTLGRAMIMVGSVRDNEYGQLMCQPDDVAGRETQSPYIVVDEIDDLYERAMDAGAEIVMSLSKQEYGGELFTCRDPEGHVWNFGSYDPWAMEEG